MILNIPGSGRAVTARRVVLRFDEGHPPFELFDLFLSTGEPQTDNINAPIEGTLVYRTRERFTGNRRHEIVLELADIADPPVRYLRVQPLIWDADSRLVQIEVDAVGDNLALSLFERGGGIDVVVDVGSSSEDRAPLGNAIGLVDGDLFSQWRHGTAARSPSNVWAEITLDLGARFGVNRIGLAPLYIGLHVCRRHQADIVAELAKLTAPVMSGPARLHANQTTRQSLEELQQLSTLDRLVEDDASILGNPVNLKHVLGQIQPYGLNCHWVAPLLAVHDNCTMAHCDAGGAGAIHPIRTGPELNCVRLA